MTRLPCYHSRMKAARTLLLLIGLLALAVPPSAPAESSGSSLYAVELIVFRVSSPAGNEDWSAAPTGRGFGNESTRGGTPQVVRILPASDFRLSSVEATLRGSGAWRPIAHAAWIQTAANWGTHVGIALADIGINTPGLSGMVYLERATYLHLGMDLSLNTAGVNYAIKEMRSVKFNERQYFDHPAFGVIAMVSPVSAARSD